MESTFQSLSCQCLTIKKVQILSTVWPALPLSASLRGACCYAQTQRLGAAEPCVFTFGTHASTLIPFPNRWWGTFIAKHYTGLPHVHDVLSFLQDFSDILHEYPDKWSLFDLHEMTHLSEDPPLIIINESSSTQACIIRISANCYHLINQQSFRCSKGPDMWSLKCHYIGT